MIENELVSPSLVATVDRLKPQVFRFLLLSVRDVEIAERLTSECLFRAYRDGFNPSHFTSATTWLMRIAIRIQNRHSRLKRLALGRQYGFETTSIINPNNWATVDHSSPELQALAQEHAGCVWKALNIMDDEERTIFLLRFVEDLELSDIVEATDLHEQTVQELLSMALLGVRLELSRVQTTNGDDTRDIEPALASLDATTNNVL